MEDKGPNKSKQEDAFEEKDPVTDPLYEVKIKKYIRQGWEIFKLYPIGFIAFSIIELIAVIFCIILHSFSPLIGLLAEVSISPIHVGICIVTIKLLQGEPHFFKDFFSGFHYYKPLIMIGLIFGIVAELDYLFSQQLVASILTLMALIMMEVVYFFTPLLVIDRRLSWWEAMETSRKAVQRRLMQIFGFSLLLNLIFMAGILALGVGCLITAPLVVCAATVAYADIFGLRSKKY